MVSNYFNRCSNTLLIVILSLKKLQKLHGVAFDLLSGRRSFSFPRSDFKNLPGPQIERSMIIAFIKVRLHQKMQLIL